MKLPSLSLPRLLLLARPKADEDSARPSETRGASGSEAATPRFVLPAIPRMPSPSMAMAASILRSFVLPLMLALVLFAGLVYFIFPTTTWLDQRAEAAGVQVELAELVQEQDVLRQAIYLMRTDDEVERIARRDFNFVYPGEEAYAVLPAPPEPVSLPSSWPFNLLYAEVLD